MNSIVKLSSLDLEYNFTANPLPLIFQISVWRKSRR